MAEQQPPPPKPTWQESLQAITNLLTPAKEAVVIIRSNPDSDTLAGGLALNLALKRIGRKSSLISSAKIVPESTPDLTFDPNQVLTFLPKNQLIFTVDFKDGSFSQGKIQKNADNLTLVLLPESGKSPLEPLRIDSAIYQSQPNITFVVGIENLSHLGPFYQENQSFFSQTPIINIDYHANNAGFGKVNLLDPKSSSISEMITLMLYDLKFVLDEEIAKTLYKGLKSKTGNFSENYFSANMLEATSICLRYMKKE